MKLGIAITLVMTLGLTAANADTSVKRLAPGVTLTQEMDKATPLLINVLSVDLTAPGVHVGVGIGQDRISGTDASKGREDVSRYARRHGTLAAINADFFPYTGDPLGIGIRGGELFSEPWAGKAPGQTRAALAFAADGKTASISTVAFLGDLQAADGARYFVSGINRAVGTGEIVAFTSLYGPQTVLRRGGSEVVLTGVNLPVRANKLISGRVTSVVPSAIAGSIIPKDGVVLSAGPGAGSAFLQQHCRVGETAGFVLSVTPPGQTHDGVKIAALPRSPGDLPSREGDSVARGAYFWANVRDAVGGGPRLLANGVPYMDGVAEGFDVNFTDSPNPRTAVGVSRDGHRLVLITVDGRQSLSRGVTLAQMALILRRYGAWNAMNLDGGGSTCLAVAGLTVNSPEGTGEERPVADMLLVDSDMPALPPPLPQISPTLAGVLLPPIMVMAGTSTHLSAPFSPAHTLWQGSVSGGVGFVNQNGYLIAQKPGQGIVTVLAGGRYRTIAVTVQAKTPPVSLLTLRAVLSPDPDSADNRSRVFVRLVDKNNAPRPNASVHITVTGGTADTDTLQTDNDGGATFGLTWSGAEGGSALIASPGVAALTILQLQKPKL